MTNHSAENEERQRLSYCQQIFQRKLNEIDHRLQEYALEIQNRKTYLWEARRDMDHIEKIAVRQTIEQTLDSAEVLKTQRQQLIKLQNSPYFGRIDFVRSGKEKEIIYIGVHHFRDEATRQTLVYDWRAPIASMFYDYEIGPARYVAPSGVVAGELQRKRQFRIREGQLLWMLESSVNIMDDVLQQELSRASDERMKNIVATIQRDQNAIIRNEHAPVLIIQGVAGSGKTSIALHRIAFLLYRFRDTLTSEDILIISPNRVFADYISNVLPELGEESVNEISMETLADELLDHQYRFQTFFEQTALLLETDDAELKRRIAVKASPDFLRQLHAYAEYVESQRFVAEDVWIARRLIPAWLIEETYHKYRGVPPKERINLVLKALALQVNIEYRYELTQEDKSALREALRKMLRQLTLRETYKQMFDWMGQPELFKLAKGGRLEYADVFPLIYLKMLLENVTSPRRHIKHLIIDEMQDYTPVQYAVIARLFPCNKTILGDATQSVNPYSASNAETIQRAFKQSTCVKLTKSYRSSFEIMQFAQAISPNPELEIIERHGEPPQLIRCKNKKEELMRIIEQIAAFSASPYNTLGVICKTQKQADKWHQAITAAGYQAHLLSSQSASYTTGIIVCSAHLAKGLEFDQVIVPDVDEKNYANEMERNILYVACTRAMHRLVLTYCGTLTRFIPA